MGINLDDIFKCVRAYPCIQKSIYAAYSDLLVGLDSEMATVPLV